MSRMFVFFQYGVTNNDTKIDPDEDIVYIGILITLASKWSYLNKVKKVSPLVNFTSPNFFHFV